MPNPITFHASRFTPHVLVATKQREGGSRGHFCFLLSAFPLPAQVWITNSITISETNAIYDGQDIVISNATVSIDGSHAFNSLLLTNGAVLTHSPCTTTNTHRLDLFVTNSVVVSADSAIDVSGKGYLPGYTTGNTTNGAASGASGGSFGGLGGNSGGSGSPWPGTANAVYGDYADPDDWGSGGGILLPAASAGGGLVRLVAEVLRLDGKLWANGGDGLRGVGSGGGIYVAVSNLIGSGSIQANGDGSTYGGGGGGRIAVHAHN